MQFQLHYPQCIFKFFLCLFSNEYLKEKYHKNIYKQFLNINLWLLMLAIICFVKCNFKLYNSIVENNRQNTMRGKYLLWFLRFTTQICTYLLYLHISMLFLYFNSFNVQDTTVFFLYIEYNIFWLLGNNFKKKNPRIPIEKLLFIYFATHESWSN